MRSRLTRSLLAVFVLALLISPDSAQSTFGSITGTVTDQSSARVSNARVTVTNQDTGVSRKTTAAADGGASAISNR